ncbi:SAM-dependent methyltransferase [Pseudalkalibacillus berkeleyi]|uniref:Class I SAM-dependent methyltransferase n=1 Tax=Pseudalkalibacillus berkeleyi TaxID=1069813 RepID=A0ABS9H2P8_9BACL|nr:class I SAM-dependent methyltransferase [Pseudalkalibacillus berkeleyi]MCF6139227.1 class I SAM-dependent methyltransferase [Pseudalkalibacillus berkeleyi]
MENKFSVIAHQNHQICNPVSQEKLLKVLERIPFKKDAEVLDIGAGKCGILIDIIEKHELFGTAIEIEEAFIKEAREIAWPRIDTGRLTILNDDAKKVIHQYDEAFDVAICIGATHAIGDYQSTLEQMYAAVKPGGSILVGEGYWKKTPHAAYLDALGAKEEELYTHAGNIQVGEDLGLVPMWASVTNEDEWDAYEWLYSSSIEKYCLENEDDSDVDWMSDRISKWRNTYLRWGRDTLGFGLYLFHKK